MKILVIDDNINISDMLSTLLTMEGHECVACNDGRKGLSLINDGNFNLVLLDLAMPEFSGHDVIDALDKSGKIKEQKIIVLTASSLLGDQTDGLNQRGVDMILSKPIDPDTLFETIANITKG